MNESAQRNWKLTKYGVAVICASFVLYGVGIFLMTELSAPIIFFSKTSSLLMAVGAALVAWDVYKNYFAERT